MENLFSEKYVSDNKIVELSSVDSSLRCSWLVGVRSEVFSQRRAFHSVFSSWHDFASLITIMEDFLNFVYGFKTSYNGCPTC